MNCHRQKQVTRGTLVRHNPKKLYQTTENDEKIVINCWRSRMQFMDKNYIYCVTEHRLII